MIAIITAMISEGEAIAKFFGLERQDHSMLTLYRGDDIYLIISGIGKTNAAIHTTVLLKDFPEITKIVNTGVAGSLESDMYIGDILMGSKVICHDSYIPTKESQEKYYGDIELTTYDIDCRVGTIATGDQFIEDSWKQKELCEKGCSAVEMECWSIARVAKKFNKEIIALKSFSDQADDDADDDFEMNITIAIDNMCLTLKSLLPIIQS